MAKLCAPQEIATRINAIHEGRVELDITTYRNVRTRCKFIDVDYGEWWTTPWGVLTGRGHPKRGRISMGLKQTITRDEMVKKLLSTCGDQITLGDDYVGVSSKCTFIDRDHGVWIQLPQRILDGTVHPKRRAEKARETCMRKHGVPHTNFLPDVWDQISKRRSKWSKHRHWMTQREIVCMSSYEVAFIKWCETHFIDFDWQVRHVMPDGHSYIIDAFIKTGEFANTWVEIKGWMRPEGKRKWDWFSKNHPNSQLWDVKRLKELQIIPIACAVV